MAAAIASQITLSDSSHLQELKLFLTFYVSYLWNLLIGFMPIDAICIDQHFGLQK
jgi:hypothetical protein